MSAVVALLENIDFKSMGKNDLRDQLKTIRDNEGMTFVDIGRQCGYSSSTISQFVHHGKTSTELESAVISFLEARYEQPEAQVEYTDEIGIYPTTEFKGVLGFCEDMRLRQKMGVVIGHPGTGKTTAIREFCERTEGAVYIEAFTSMRMQDLLSIMAEASGTELKRGSNYAKVQQLIGAMRNKELMFVIDEAEYLKKWDVDKFEILRKIWDNTSVPILLCGTHDLEEILTRGNGKDNLAQLYRRKYMMKLEGIKEKEVREILKRYNITREAANHLVAAAIDVRHGGLGNFVELLELCLEAAEGSEISIEIVKDAKKYKLMF